MMAGNITIICV